MPITLKSTGGGSVSIDVPSTGATFTLTAPANNATIFTTDGGAITGNVAFTSNNISIGGQTISPAVGMRNRIINGDMRVDQRNAGASVTASATNANTYTLDRWAYYVTAASKFTVQQNAGAVTSAVGFPNYLGVTSSSAYTVASGDILIIRHAIEGLNVSDLGWGSANAKTVTLSFWVRSSLTGTFGGAICNNAGDRSYPFSYSIGSANTWTQISVTVPGDTTGTWLTTNGVGIYVQFNIGTGTTYSGTAGSWAATFYSSATGATNIVATNGATFYITGVQLEVGNVATPFERRLYGTELALCQRYYQKSYDVGTIPATATRLGIHGIGGLYGSGSCINGLTFRTSMRTAPTVTIYDGAGTTGVLSLFYAGSWTDNSGQVRALNTSENGFNCNYGYVSNPWTTGQPGNCHWKADAEI